MSKQVIIEEKKIRCQERDLAVALPQVQRPKKDGIVNLE